MWKKKKPQKLDYKAICNVLAYKDKTLWPRTYAEGEQTLGHTLTYNHTHLSNMLMEV